MNKLIINALIVNEGVRFKGNLLIEGDRIKEIHRSSDNYNLQDNTELIDAEGLILIPGIIDDQVHFRDPGLTHKADLNTETRAAVAGGVTSIMDMPNTIPQTTTTEELKKKQLLGAEKSLCNYSFYFGATNDNTGEIKKTDPATTCGIKVFMGASTGNMLVDNINSLRSIFANSKIPVACHCEDEPVIQKNLSNYKNRYGDNIPIELHPEIRSREACIMSSSLAIKLAREYKTRLHVLHISTAEETELFENQTALADKMITSEVCVHHLWFDDSHYKEKGAKIKWNPAIKTAADRKKLIESLNSDRIDILATDHAPHTMEEKNAPYTSCPSGGPLIQHSLVAMLELCRKGTFKIEKIVEKMCHNPAILFNIKDRGFIKEGYKADLCLLNPNSRWKVSKDNILYKCGWSPFEDEVFHNRVEKTFVNGSLAYDNGKINDKIRGELLIFNR